MTTYRKSMAQALNEVYLDEKDAAAPKLSSPPQLKAQPALGAKPELSAEPTLSASKKLGEDNMALLKKAAGGAMQTLKMKDGKIKMDSFTASAIMGVYKAINPKNKKTLENVVNTGTKSALMKLQSLAMKSIKSGYHEEVELDEKKIVLAKGMGKEVINDNGVIKVMKGGKVISDGDYDSGAGKFWMNIEGKKGQVAFDDPEELLKIKEEVELEEGRMKELHMLIKQGKSAEEIAKIMKLDKKTIQALMAGYMSSSYHEARDIDPADVDDAATDDDVKAADKNILMQMRKVISLRGNFKVEFGDKKKIKIDPKIAHAVQKKYDSIKRPIDKQKFTIRIAKSYKDMLAALKESLGEARQLKDPKKEMMIVKDKRVIVIDKKDWKKYEKKGWSMAEEVELDEVFDFVLLDKDNKIAGRYSGSNAKKEAESGKKSAHLPPMSIPKGDVKKMKIVPISPKDKKDIGDTVLAIGEAGWTDRKDPIPAGKELAKHMKKKKGKKEDVQEGTWALPDTPKLKAGLKKLMKKPIPLGKDGNTAIDWIGHYIGDDGLYDALHDAAKEDGPKADARPVIRGWMDKEFVDSWKKYRIETTILDRIDRKIQEKKDG